MKLRTERVHQHLDVDEGGEVELVSRPLAHEELVTLLLRQSVQELTERNHKDKLETRRAQRLVVPA